MENKRAICTTVREGIPCIFMKKDKGCTFVDGYCRPTIDQCKGCEHSKNQYCDAYMNPITPWTYWKECPLATHLDKKESVEKKVLDPRKAAKLRRKQGG